MESGTKSLLLLFPLLFFSCSLGLGTEEKGSTNLSSNSRIINAFDVGVILETKSWIGKISWSCMRMAADDFYAANPGYYSSRLSLHLRDSKGDAFRATTAGIDLLKTNQAQAIIALQTSAESRFLMKIGDKACVPILSFSEINPLSTQKSPYYIYTSMMDSAQAKITSSILQNFRWNQVVPVVEDNGNGNGIITHLMDAFQKIDVRVPYRSIIPSSATKEQILKELIKLKRMETRVFVVHMTRSLGLQLFTIAKEEGMLEEGYVWITTYALTDAGLSAMDVMQGVVGMKPYVRETEKLRNFKQRWREKFLQENADAQITEPTLFGLWAYDAVWLLAMAAEGVRMDKARFEELDVSNGSTDLASIGVHSDGPELLKSIQRSDFDGLAGRFHLVENQLEFQTFEIVNFVGHDQRRIGFWRAEYGVSGSKNFASELDVVTWPGSTKVAPKGWEWPTKGNTLRIAVPVQPKFNKFLYAEGDPNNLTVKGYSIDVFKAVMKKLPDVAYDLIPYGFDRDGEPNATYDEILYQVYLQNFDAVVGDVTIIVNRSLYVDFTYPYTDSGISMLVPVKDKLQKGAWTFLKPLDKNLWLASGAFFIFTGFVVWLLEHRINEKFRGTPADQLGNVLYFTFSSLVFAHREKLFNNLSRTVIVVWLFVVLILKSIYTANLSSILTVEQLQPTVRDLDDVIKQGLNVGYMNNSFKRNLFKQWNLDKSKLIAFDSREEYQTAVLNGTLKVFLEETPYLKSYLNDHCGKYAMIGPIYKTDGFGFAFPKGSLLVQEVSRAILKLLESDEMGKIEEEIYGSQVCDSNEYDGTSLTSLTLRSFWGLFLMTGIASITALILCLVSFLKKHGEFLSNINSENSLSRRLVELVKIYDLMDAPSPPKAINAQEEQAGSSRPESSLSTHSLQSEILDLTKKRGII